MNLQFTKMQALGNDYIYIYGSPDHPEELARRLSDRHFGVGGDGLILMGPSQRGDFSMAIYNADGGAATLCGNGLRCVGKYLYDKGYTDRTTLTVETGAGLRTLYLTVTEGKVSSVKVDMGRVTVSPQTGLGVPVDVGNPHLVVFVSPLEQTLAETLGPKLEQSEPGGVNVEFIQVLDERTLRMRVWERGSGLTMACGTGACAAAAAAVARGFCPRNEALTVRLDGGDLKITVLEEDRVLMEGEAHTVYEGVLDL